jgi:glycosyltransferase involved in cell wall biosynthesis
VCVWCDAGEGWCLPAAEAMAMALPVIITNYSGPTGYATPDNAYLIPVQDTLNSEGYAEPDVDVLMSLMLHVRTHPEETRGKGARAREAMQAISPRSVVSAMADRLRELAKMRGWEE